MNWLKNIFLNWTAKKSLEGNYHKPMLVPNESSQPLHMVKASSFADPADIRAFRQCKATGKTNKECFRVGDNGIGCWGDDTTVDKPMCALPPEDYEQFGDFARGKLVFVTANRRTIICELRDRMPSRRFIRNGAGIDLNPAACRELGLTPPVMVAASWRWVDILTP